MNDKTKVTVDGMQWDIAAVKAEKSKTAFVEKHMKDADIYPRMLAEKKKASLELVYDVCVPKKAAEAATPKIEEVPTDKKGK